MEESPATVERSDVCAISAAAVVGEAMVALVLADALLEKCGADTLDEVLAHLTHVRERHARHFAGRGLAAHHRE
jgi:chorismate synthase